MEGDEHVIEKHRNSNILNWRKTDRIQEEWGRSMKFKMNTRKIHINSINLSTKIILQHNGLQRIINKYSMLYFLEMFRTNFLYF